MTTALATPPATDTAIADLVLVRMALPSKRPVAASVVRKDVGKLLSTELSTDEFASLRDELASAGLLAKGKRNMFTLTDAGRARALSFLDMSELPANANWTALIATHLFPKAVTMSADAAATLSSGDKLAALLLKRKYGLGSGAGSTVSQVLEAIVCKQLDFPDENTLDGLLCAVLSRIMGSERLTKEQLVKQFPLFETGLTAVNADAARCKLVGDWLGLAQRRPRQPSPAEPQSAEPFDLAAFAATVRALAANSRPDDRFHDNRVFIAALWRASQQEPNFPRVSLPDFKQRLVEANSQNLLHLSRADLVAAMDPQMVTDSETAYLNATFHFVQLEEDRP
jgi:hypothetical protein